MTCMDKNIRYIKKEDKNMTSTMKDSRVGIFYIKNADLIIHIPHR